MYEFDFYLIPRPYFTPLFNTEYIIIVTYSPTYPSTSTTFTINLSMHSIINAQFVFRIHNLQNIFSLGGVYMGLACNGNLSLKKFKCLGVAWGQGMLKFLIDKCVCLMQKISRENNRPLDSK